jgi:hypothetical protein
MSMVEGVEARGMKHCETTTLGVLLRHEGVDLSEPMLFGLGSGLSFIYWDAKGMGFPFLGGRIKPFELTRNVAARLGLELRVEETTSQRKAWQNVASQIDAGRPVGLQLDSYHLAYFPAKTHFGGHVVAMYGYDDHYAYLVDTDQVGGAVRTGLAGLAAARAERGPMTARNRSFTITAPGPVSVTRDQLIAAIRHCAEEFLASPIANLGHRGIAKAARRVRTWLRRTDRPGEDLAHGTGRDRRGAVPQPVPRLPRRMRRLDRRRGPAHRPHPVRRSGHAVDGSRGADRQGRRDHRPVLPRPGR